MTTNYIDLTKHGLTDDSKTDAVGGLAALILTDAKLKEFSVVHATASAEQMFDFLLAHEQAVVEKVVKPSDVPETAKTDRDVYDAYYSVLYSLLLETKAAAQVERVRLLAARLATTDYSEQPELRLKQLMILYNSLPVDAAGRFEAFKQILAHATNSNQLSILKPYVARASDWLADWQISKEQTHELYMLVAAVYEKLESPEDQIKSLYTLLDLYEGADAAELAKHAAVGVQLLTTVIDAPHVLDFTEFLGLAVVQQLETTEHKTLVAMVHLLSRGDLQSFITNHPASDKFFATYKLSHEACLTKMRLLTLANIAQAGELPLSDVAQVLKMDEAEAEQWVVRAVSSQILNARVDQIKRVVLVKSAFQRSFGQDQWKKLHEQLGSWIGNLERISGVLAATRTAPGA